MQVIADLHLHSKYSRAVSRDMVLPTMAAWGKKKGIDLLTTGDWTHPLWFREIRGQLEEAADGVYKLKSPHFAEASRGKQKEPLFLLTVEVSSIYSQGGKLRRMHNLIFAPNFDTAEKINKELQRRGVNLLSDGRPIMGLSAKDLLEMVLTIDKQVLFVPAHCLLPDALIHTKEGMEKIKNVAIGDFVYTHKNRARRVTEIFRRPYLGDLYHIRPWYFSLGLATTSEHPFYALRVKNCSTKGGRCLPTPSHKKICKKRIYDTYRPEWIIAKNLTVGDMIVFPRFHNTTPVTHLILDIAHQYKTEGGKTYTGGSRGHIFSEKVGIDKNFCRLIGYYLAEGYTNGRDEVAFAFHEDEKDYVADVISLMNEVFGISHHRIYKRAGLKSVEISFYSKLLIPFFTNHFYTNSPHRATTKTIPDWMLHLPLEMQAELLRGWWRGDGGYTSSRQLMNGMKIICLRLGIIPSISADSKENYVKRGKHHYHERKITASENSYVFSHLAFFEDFYNLLSDKAFKDCIRKINRRHGWIDENYIYLPIRKILKSFYQGEVFNLEVEEDNSYVAEFATVHNCWTPWFSLYGSNSGFDTIEECFGDYAKYIYGVETGLSSDPLMNWQISELENRSLLSFSDAHSPAKMGREATVFELPEISYENIRRAIVDGRRWKVEDSVLKMEGGSLINPQVSNFKDLSSIINHPSSTFIAFTIEFYPEEGKYHYTGHRNCNIVQSPQDSAKNGTTCPVCKRKLTVGVEHRVQELAGEKAIFDIQKSKKDEFGVSWIYDPKGIHPPYVSLVPLLEIIREALEVGEFSNKARELYEQLTQSIGTEYDIIFRTNLSIIESKAGSRVAEGIGKVRQRDIVVVPGYDGVFGVVKIWSSDAKVVEGKSEPIKEVKQMGLF